MKGAVFLSVVFGTGAFVFQWLGSASFVLCGLVLAAVFLMWIVSLISKGWLALGFWFSLLWCLSFLRNDPQLSDVGPTHWYKVDGLLDDFGWLQQWEILPLISNQGLFSGANSLRLDIKKGLDQFQNGDLLYLEKKVQAFRTTQFPGDFPEKAYWEGRGFSGFIGPLEIQGLIKLKGPAEERSRLLRLRNWIKQQFESALGENQVAALSLAVTTGEKALLEKRTKELFKSSGTIHVLAVSGLHVGLVWWGINGVLFFLTFIRQRRLKLLLALFLLLFYCALTGFPPSVCRAALMLGMYSIAKSMNRARGVWPIYFHAFWIILFLQPTMLFDLGFQLSFSALAGILLFFGPLKAVYNGSSFLLDRVATLLVVSLSAQLGCLPFLLYHFGEFPSGFLIGNLLALPLLIPFIYLSIALLIFSAMGPLSTIIAQALHFLFRLIEFLQTWVQDTFPILKFRNFGLFELTVALAILLFLNLFVQSKRPKFLLIGLCLAVFLVSASLHKQLLHARSSEILTHKRGYEGYRLGSDIFVPVSDHSLTKNWKKELERRSSYLGGEIVILKPR